MKATPDSNDVHVFFYGILLVKLTIAVFQVIGGVLAYMMAAGGNILVHFIPQQTIRDLVTVLTFEELTEDPRDFLANYLLHLVQTFSMGTLHFIAFYLTVHGLIKLWLISGLLRRKLWYYPVSIGIFGLFMVYQVYRFSFTHSPFLIVLTVIDVFVIWLTWREYNYLRSTSLPTDVSS